jgi:hypothetical protein
MNAIILHRTDPAKNMRRFYSPIFSGNGGTHRPRRTDEAHDALARQRTGKERHGYKQCGHEA